MGNTPFPSTLKELASYCDCLESTQRFAHEKQPTEQSQKAESEHKSESTPKKQQLRRQPNPVIEQPAVEAPQPAKIYQPLAPQPSLKRRSDLQIKQSVINLPKMDEISQLSEEPRPQKNQSLQMFEFDKDQDVRANNMFKHYNPLFHSHTDMRGRRRAPLVKKTFNEDEGENIEISQINETPSHDMGDQFSLNDEDQKQYRDTSKSHYS